MSDAVVNFSGTVVVEATNDICSGQGTTTITGGTFSHDPTSYVAEGYDVTENDNGTWTVTCTHSFTKYEETEAPKCGVAGKKVANCDNGCGATDEREIAALEHVFGEYTSNGDATCTADGTKTAECANGCGATDTVTDEDSMLDHTDEDGDKVCDDCEAEIVDTCPDCGRKAHDNSFIQSLVCLIIMLINLIKTAF